jgi:hypothetical protein
VKGLEHKLGANDESSSKVSELQTWTTDVLQKENLPPCTEWELSSVLSVREKEELLMVDGGEVYFI